MTVRMFSTALVKIGVATALAVTGTATLAKNDKHEDRSFSELSGGNHGPKFDKDWKLDGDWKGFKDWKVDNNANHVAAVPEPETWALMLAGGALVVWATRRRRNRR